jgi:ribosomal RNA-processing protein 7
MSIPKKFGDFLVLTVSYSPQATHYLYIRAHASRTASDDLPTDRTLFLVNIPPDSTERELITLFSTCGAIDRVKFGGQEALPELDDNFTSCDEEDIEEDTLMQEHQDATKILKNTKREKKQPPPKVVPLPTIALRHMRRTGSTAHIVFTSAQGLSAALSLPSTSTSDTECLVWPKFKATSAAEPSGLAHYKAKYRTLRPPLVAVREHANSSMEVFEYRQALESKQNSKYKKGEAIVDEDGFTLVTRGGAYGQTLGGGVGVASKKFMKEIKGDGSKRKKNKKIANKEGFYAFQTREKRIQGLKVLPGFRCIADSDRRTSGAQEGI